jgi:hypothetical protein
MKGNGGADVMPEIGRPRELHAIVIDRALPVPAPVTRSAAPPAATRRDQPALRRCCCRGSRSRPAATKLTSSPSRMVAWVWDYSLCCVLVDALLKKGEDL